MNEPVTIDPEFQNLIPPLSPEEFKQLEENCRRDGILDSLKVWNGILIDGHNRLKISEKWDLNYQVEEMDFLDREAVIRWIILNQFGRRNLSVYDRSVLALKLKPVIAEQAKERMKDAPQKKAEREKEIQKICDEYDFNTAQNLIAVKKQAYAREDRAEKMAGEKYIYFARLNNNNIKIGSSVYPDVRVKQLSVSCPGIELIDVVFFGHGAEKHERAIAKKFEQYKISNECYQCSDEVISQMISFTKKEAARKTNTDYQLAKVAGVSHDTIHKVEVIEKEASPEIRQAVKSGEISINNGYQQVMREKTPSAQKPANQAFEARQRHKEFEQKKTEGVVDIRDARQDKEDQQAIAKSLYRDLLTLTQKSYWIGAFNKSEDFERVAGIIPDKERMAKKIKAMMNVLEKLLEVL